MIPVTAYQHTPMFTYVYSILLDVDIYIAARSIDSKLSRLARNCRLGKQLTTLGTVYG